MSECVSWGEGSGSADPDNATCSIGKYRNNARPSAHSVEVVSSSPVQESNGAKYRVQNSPQLPPSPSIVSISIAIDSASASSTPSASVPVLDEKDRVHVSDSEKRASTTSVLASLFSLLLSIPVLIGSWCWPSLVVGFLTGSTSAATSASRAFSHYITFGVTAVMMVVMTVLHARSARTRYGSSLRKYGPLILTVLAALLILAEPTRTVLCNPSGAWQGPRKRGFSAAVKSWFFFLSSYVGYTALYTAVFWNANVLDKLKAIREKWKELRGQLKNESSKVEPDLESWKVVPVPRHPSSPLQSFLRIHDSSSSC